MARSKQQVEAADQAPGAEEVEDKAVADDASSDEEAEDMDEYEEDELDEEEEENSAVREAWGGL